MAQTNTANKPATMPPCMTLHELHTVENSAAYLLPKLHSMQKTNPHLKVLDIGCGFGIMTTSLAQAVAPHGHITGIDLDKTKLVQARALADKAGVGPRVDLLEADAYKLPFADGDFDIVHCHQVLTHAKAPWDMLREMMRVTRLGGVVACREGDYRTEAVWPAAGLPGLQKFHGLVGELMKVASGGDAGDSSGRQLLPWALKAGAARDRVALSFGAWWFETPEHKDLWANAMADQAQNAEIREMALKLGLCSESDLEEMATSWEAWARREDSSLSMMHGEIIVQM